MTRVVMTQGAQAFITPLTLQALSGEPVYTELLDESAEAGMGHIELARWADVVLVAPATADIISRLARGRADDLLTTLILATPAPVLLAPAMNQQMWRNPATQANIETLRSRGVAILGPDTGEQACGDVGEGRLLPADDIVEATAALFDSAAMSGRKIVVSAGPTREPLDPVRFLSNHSSGKMGFAMARAAQEAGGDVVLVTGPVALDTPDRVKRINIETAGQLLDAVTHEARNADVFISTAAVADYRAAAIAEQKIKKEGAGHELSLALIRNPDIVGTIATGTDRPQVVVGFAAETEHVIANAQRKLSQKTLDWVVANDVSRQDIGFNSDRNEVTAINRSGVAETLHGSKLVIARRLISLFAESLADHDWKGEDSS